ncbi:MAG: glucose-1-phosphate thymidylyltransferase RfbA [Candidatus Omnitrophica bacterium]|nr:glucose-1-phosphate thymidylyltransferase RfbA [Candidatus Omnitrophota bacterium]
MKGIILAGGKATRLYPITKSISKQLLPIYDKPMIYYPLSVLMLAGIKDILIISTPEALGSFKALLGDGKDLGIDLSYAAQPKPGGIGQAFLIGEEYIAGENVCLVLGDNLFYGDHLSMALQKATKKKQGATIFGYLVNNPEEYGVIALDKNKKVISIEEKPKKPKSHWVVTGLYFYDQDIVKIAKNTKPSKRGEIEITDINKAYLKRKNLDVQFLGRGCAWLDTGTYESLIEASLFIKTIQERQGLKIGCIEEVAYRMKFISREQLEKLSRGFKTEYGSYLKRLAQGDK